MKRLAALVLFCSMLTPAFALSREIGRDIEFPKGYDPSKAQAILKVVEDARFNFVGGIVSYWPPDWSTRLSFEGDAASLNQFILALRQIPAVGFRLVLYAGRNDELRRDSSWQLDFSHAHPDELTLYLSLNSKNVDFGKVQFPAWLPPVQPSKPLNGKVR